MVLVSDTMSGLSDEGTCIHSMKSSDALAEDLT